MAGVSISTTSCLAHLPPDHSLHNLLWSGSGDWMCCFKRSCTSEEVQKSILSSPWFTVRKKKFFLRREYLDPYFSEMFRPNGSLLTGRRRDRGDSSAALGNSGSTQMRVTRWVTQWGEGISRTVTHLSANTSPAAMEELVSGTRSPFTWDI